MADPDVTPNPPAAGAQPPTPAAPAAPAAEPEAPLAGRNLWAAGLVFAYLAISATWAGLNLASTRANPKDAIVGLPDAIRTVIAKHCVPPSPPPATTPAAPPATTPTGDTPAPAAAPGDQVCSPSLARGLLEDAFYTLAFVGIVGGSLSGLWSLVMFIGHGTFRSSWVAFYLIRPLAGAVAAPSILFGLDLFQLRPSSIQVCIFLAFLASVAVQYYMKKLFDLSRTLFLTETNAKDESFRSGKGQDGAAAGGGAGKDPQGGGATK